MGLKAFNKWGFLILYPKTSTQDNKQLVDPFWDLEWEVGLAPNIIMKGINIFTADIIKDFPYNYDKIIQVLWKKGNISIYQINQRLFVAFQRGVEELLSWLPASALAERWLRSWHQQQLVNLHLSSERQRKATRKNKS